MLSDPKKKDLYDSHGFDANTQNNMKDEDGMGGMGGGAGGQSYGGYDGKLFRNFNKISFFSGYEEAERK